MIRKSHVSNYFKPKFLDDSLNSKMKLLILIFILSYNICIYIASNILPKSINLEFFAVKVNE